MQPVRACNGRNGWNDCDISNDWEYFQLCGVEWQLFGSWCGPDVEDFGSRLGVIDHSNDATKLPKKKTKKENEKEGRIFFPSHFAFFSFVSWSKIWISSGSRHFRLVLFNGFLVHQKVMALKDLVFWQRSFVHSLIGWVGWKTALKLLWNCSEIALKLLWKYWGFGLKLVFGMVPELLRFPLWTRSDAPLKLLWNCPETALNSLWNGAKTVPILLPF